MILSKVELSNFKKHKSLAVDLVTGLNTIAGLNYSGKSTIQQAILYSLFGVSAVPGLAENLLTKGQSGNPAVSLHFQVGKELYKIVRNGSNATLYKGGKVLSRSSTEVLQEVEKLLGLTKEQFLDTRVGKQGDPHTLLATGTQKLKKLVENLSGCEIIDKIQKRALENIKISNAQIEALTEGLDTTLNLKELKANVGSLTKLEVERAASKLGLENIKKDLKESLAGAEDTLLVKKNEHDDYVKQLSHYNHFQSRVALLTSSYDDLVKGEFILKDPEAVAETIRKEGDIILNYQAAKEAYTLINQELITKTCGLQEATDSLELAEKATAGASPEAKKDKGDKDLHKARLQRDKTDKDLLAVDASLKGSKCNTCNRAFDTFTEKELADLSAKKDKLASSLPKLEDKVDKLEQEQKSLDSSYNDYTLNIALLKTYKEKAEGLAVEVEQCTAKVKEIDYDPELEVTDVLLRQSQEALAKHHVAVKSLQDCTDNLNTATKTFEGLDKPVAVDITEAVGSVEKYTSLLLSNSEKLIEVSAFWCECLSDLQTAKATLTQHEATNSKVEQLVKTVAGYKSISKAIIGNRSKLLESVWFGLLEEAGSFVNACTSGDISALSVDNNFNITYKEGEHTLPVEASSGAQKSLIGLGIRFAIANMLPSNVEFITMDEATSDMTDSLSAIAMALLRKKSSQIIAISHRTDDIVTSDNVIRL